MRQQPKIGIIQNSPLTADFSGNIRQIIQGYRECADHGADLVIAPAYGLSGAQLKDLANRSSFLHQINDALEYLAQEVSGPPLLVASYISVNDLFLADYEDEDNGDFDVTPTLATDENQGLLVPFLIEPGDITELEDSEVVYVAGMKVYIDLHDEEIGLEDLTPDLIVHMGTCPWYATSAKEFEERHRFEASENAIPVVSVKHVGASNGVIYGGGSAIYLPNGMVQTRLPFFTPMAKVCTIDGTITAKSLPSEVELLSEALIIGIRDTVKNSGYEGVCFNLNSPYAELLAVLSAKALGSDKVYTLNFSEQESTVSTLGVNVKNIRLNDVCKDIADSIEEQKDQDLEKRIQNTTLITYADANGLMPLTAITRHDIMTGNFVLYGNAGGYLAPLGNLYAMDAYLLSTYYKEQYPALFGTLQQPASPEQDRIIHELADKNIGASSLLHDHLCPFEENSVRSIQRRIISSALKRTMLPVVLQVDKPRERMDIPFHHRLND